MNRNHRAGLAAETLTILESGQYTSASGRKISIVPQMQECLDRTQLFRPTDLPNLLNQARSQPPAEETARLEVANETTLAGIDRLLAETAGPVASLNFASAKNPGGGFLGGSQAQEESLARSSGLYPSLLKAPAYYETHRKGTSALYTDTMILSPDCPIFRDDAGSLLDEPRLATFITSAAPNAGAIKQNSPSDTPNIPAAFLRRGEYVLALAAAHGCRSIVLGAWGCGVFRNDPTMVAETLRILLMDKEWNRRFSHVRFSVFDSSERREVYEAFRETLLLGASPRIAPREPQFARH